MLQINLHKRMRIPAVRESANRRDSMNIAAHLRLSPILLPSSLRHKQDKVLVVQTSANRI